MNTIVSIEARPVVAFVIPQRMSSPINVSGTWYYIESTPRYIPVTTSSEP
jgi:hypothetical protein